MYFYNHRLLEGKPLHYYHYNSQSHPRVDLISSEFPTNFFPGPDKLTCLDQNRDSIMPLPPTSPQSDSENSICSVEVPYKELNSVRPTNNSKSDCICYWINCGLSFESLDLLANHVSRVHAASGPGGLFYCRWEGCTRNNKGFNARYKMLVHVRTHTNEKPHKCSQCEKSFSRAENLKIHIRSHSGEKPYVCPVPGCNKAYSNSSDRFKHTRTHQVEKPYQCKVSGCPKRYTDPSSLRKHVKTYKHFVSEEKKAPESISPRNVSVIVSNTSAGGNEEICEKDATKTTEQRLSASLTETKSCSCGCANNSYYLSEKDDCISYEKMMCFKNSSFDTVSWNVLTSYTAQKNIYKPYELHQEEMEIDLPLDLSISTRE